MLIFIYKRFESLTFCTVILLQIKALQMHMLDRCQKRFGKKSNFIMPVGMSPRIGTSLIISSLNPPVPTDALNLYRI